MRTKTAKPKSEWKERQDQHHKDLLQNNIQDIVGKLKVKYPAANVNEFVRWTDNDLALMFACQSSPDDNVKAIQSFKIGDARLNSALMYYYANFEYIENGHLTSLKFKAEFEEYMIHGNN